MQAPLPCIVLAAGKANAALQQATGLENKALIPVGGRPVIAWVLDALRATPAVGDLCVVCRQQPSFVGVVGDLAVEANGPAFLDSIRTGLERLGNPAQVLIVTGDLPLLTATSVAHFCEEGLSSGAEIVYSVVTREGCEAKLPGAPRTYMHLTEGPVTGGNLALLSRRFIEEEGARLAAAFAGRKNPFRLAAMIGYGTLLRLIVGRASMVQMIARASSILAASIHVVVSPYPEVGIDVDKPAHVSLVEGYLSRQLPG
jgi:molybdopterin-guanine dinucleotide biosynthesis protein A